ncbi:MAG: lipopolysaccharide transport periplasmic protein LptA [Hydrogenophilus sp.]|nr:lipopolysaccharide transport periplasmic protein LptA [Hydrogenophilus sp.]
MKFLFSFLLLLLLSLHPLPSSAKKSDRQQPVEIDADRITIDEKSKTHHLEGNVRLQQGTLEIRADEILIRQDAEGFRHGTAIGKNRLASFRQQKEASSEWITGEAERLEYDARAERLTLSGRARLTSGPDLVEGAIITYEISSETFRVTHAGAPSSAPSGRVRAVIQPKNRSEPLPSTHSFKKEPTP